MESVRRFVKNLKGHTPHINFESYYAWQSLIGSILQSRNPYITFFIAIEGQNIFDLCFADFPKSSKKLYLILNNVEWIPLSDASFKYDIACNKDGNMNNLGNTYITVKVNGEIKSDYFVRLLEKYNKLR